MMAISDKQASPMMNRPRNSARQSTARSTQSRDRDKGEQRLSARPDSSRAKSTVAAATQTSARSDGLALATGRSTGRSCRGGGAPDSARTEPRTARSVLSARSSEGSMGEPRETGRTTTSMAMSTSRAEATLAVLEAERAQLERRLKRVEEELAEEELLRR